ncbi:hypothetical protein BOSEA31B_20636 [Hyphomicrobiales bacterium]|nr:hypothetical protein BOSEA31B_20636 [Hyphomicrobiales bacterium]CAH1702869.1 hypothetical protein BOSEA1005_30742 [Hyphomicrobiales bacterium]CAI0347056.1 hypothetical protein BO1005MUT1_530232 [Hyphomicrobiales bacterium]
MVSFRWMGSVVDALDGTEVRGVGEDHREVGAEAAQHGETDDPNLDIRAHEARDHRKKVRTRCHEHERGDYPEGEQAHHGPADEVDDQVAQELTHLQRSKLDRRAPAHNLQFHERDPSDSTPHRCYLEGLNQRIESKSFRWIGPRVWLSTAPDILGERRLSRPA